MAVKQFGADTGLGKARDEVLAAMSVAHDHVVHIVAVSMDPAFTDRQGLSHLHSFVILFLY